MGKKWLASEVSKAVDRNILMRGGLPIGGPVSGEGSFSPSPINAQISDGGDDAYESATGAVSVSQTMYLTAINRWASGRFPSIKIPQGSTIVTCTMEFFLVYTDSYNSMWDFIYFEKVASPAPVVEEANNISGRLLTSAVSTYLHPKPTNIGVWFTSPELAPALQEVVDSYDTDGIHFLVKHASNNRDWAPERYERSPEDAMKIHIEYE